MPIGASGGRWKPNSSGPMPATSSPRRRNCRRSKPRLPTVCPTILLLRLPPTRRKKTAGAVDGRIVGAVSAMPVLSDEARAKVNLTLRVNGRRADGFHDLESVVAFADCADRLTLTPGSDLDLKMSGPLAQACGETSDNLVLKAARLLAERGAGGAWAARARRRQPPPAPARAPAGRRRAPVTRPLARRRPGRRGHSAAPPRPRDAGLRAGHPRLRRPDKQSTPVLTCNPSP